MNRKKIINKGITLVVALCATVCMASAAFAASYYVDAVNGSDSNVGSQSAPWQTVSKVNSVSFAPGDNIYFKTGCTFSGSLYPKSGSSSANITYGAYGTGAMPILDSCTMHSVNYVTVQELEFLSVGNIPVDLQGASHNTVQNCAIYADVSNTSTWTALFVRDGSSYNKILNNSVERRNTNSQGNALSIGTNTNYNLVQGNHLGTATHYSLDVIGAYSSTSQSAMYNVIRNNVINNPYGAMSELIMYADYNVLDGNIISGGLSTGNDANAGNTLALGASHNIIRNNVFKDNPSSGDGIAAMAFASGSLLANVVSNRVYNNTLTNIAYQPIVMDNYGTASISDNIFKNNIIANNPTSNGVQVRTTPYAGTYFFGNNMIYDVGITNVLNISNALESVATANSNNSSSFSGNQQLEPMLNSNGYPQSGSPAIGAGTYLTTVTSASGSGSVITVKDASYFTDGFGIVQGDTIRVGSSTATIKSVNYSTNTITLTSTISWNSGDAVNIAFSGSAPSIGAYPPATLSPPTNLVIQ